MDKRLKLVFVLFLLGLCSFTSCASRESLRNEPQIVKKPEGCTSPNQKIEVEILVQKTESSSPEASFTKGTLRPGAIIPQHTHTDSDEYISFISGEGELTIGEETYFVQDGETYYIPRGVQHSYVNREKKDATFFQVYSPGGPEQRFKKWSELKGP